MKCEGTTSKIAVPHCLQCGAVVPEELPSALCPKCALSGALDLGKAFAVGLADGVRCFGDYELLEEVARGGMGIVYKARQLSLGRIVAVKMLLIGRHASAQFIKRFRDEASNAAALQHPNIVAIHDVQVHEGEHILVMDYIEGPNLAKLVGDRPLPAKRAARYMQIIADAIQHAHECHILHRDLKPSNVLIDSQDQPRVTDFGLAKRLVTDWSSRESSLTVDGQVLGSPSYMSPEQAHGVRDAIGVRSDVYSMGAMLYHLLTGRPPFVGETAADTVAQVQHHEPVRPRLLNSAVPRDLETICLKCLEKDPRHRYARAKDFSDDLNRWLSMKPIHARRTAWPIRAVRWTRRNPVGAALIVSLVVGLVIALVLWRVVAAQRDYIGKILVVQQEKIWSDSKESCFRLTAEELGAIRGKFKRDIPGESLRIKVALGAKDPFDRAMRLAPLLDSIEDFMERKLNRPVLIDLVLMKPGRFAKNILTDGTADIVRAGAVTLAHAFEASPGLEPLLAEKAEKISVIFVRSDSGITNILQLRDRIVAFADEDSTISLFAKAYLLSNGLTASKLHTAKVLDATGPRRSQLEAAARNKPGRLAGELAGQWNSHAEVIEAVRIKQADAGTARRKNVQDYINRKEFVILGEFEATPNLWAATSRLPAPQRKAFSEALLAIENGSLLVRMPNTPVGFKDLSVEEMNEFRKEVKDIESKFDDLP